MASKSVDSISNSLSKASLTSSNSSTTLSSQVQSSAPPALTGSCQCGAVKYSSTVLPSSFTNCHCITCRKISGSAYITFGEFPSSSITFLGPNKPKQNKTSDIAIRQHCADCGSPISMQYLCEPEVVHLTAGSIDEESVRGKLPVVKQCIFMPDRKGMWYDVDARVAKFARFSASMQKKIDAWKGVLAGPGLG